VDGRTGLVDGITAFVDGIMAFAGSIGRSTRSAIGFVSPTNGRLESLEASVGSPMRSIASVESSIGSPMRALVA